VTSRLILKSWPTQKKSLSKYKTFLFQFWTEFHQQRIRVLCFDPHIFLNIIGWMERENCWWLLEQSDVMAKQQTIFPHSQETDWTRFSTSSSRRTWKIQIDWSLHSERNR
jgi:hypothetical protein